MPVTRDQERAKHALRFARQLTDKDSQTYAKKLPVLIQTCGLSQALAFLQAKQRAPKLLEALEAWVGQTIPFPPTQQLQRDRNILNRIVEGEPDFLFRATDEALAYLFWIGRFTEAEETADGGQR